LNMGACEERAKAIERNAGLRILYITILN
jgi:hypothetical protein